MFSRLDQRYGNPRKIVDVVVADLKALKPIQEGDSRGFINLAERVEC